MKTSYSRAQGMRAFHTYVSEILNYREYLGDIKYQSSCIKSFASTILSKAQESLQQVHHQIRVWGDGEEGMRKWGDR